MRWPQFFRLQINRKWISNFLKSPIILIKIAIQLRVPVTCKNIIQSIRVLVFVRSICCFTTQKMSNLQYKYKLICVYPPSLYVFYKTCILICRSKSLFRLNAQLKYNDNRFQLVVKCNNFRTLRPTVLGLVSVGFSSRAKLNYFKKIFL